MPNLCDLRRDDGLRLMPRLVVIDTETHCFDGEEGEARVVELAAVHDPERLPLAPMSWLYSPGAGRAITARASAVHHLTDADVTGLPEFDDVAWCSALGGQADYVVAHNVAFDRTVIERSLKREAVETWICTLKASRVAWPDAPSHSLQTLRYYLGLSGELPAGLVPHRAAYDAVVGSWLLVRLLAHFDNDLEHMAAISEQPSLLRAIGFGKHRGTLWKDAPRDYLRWVLGQDFDADTRFTAKHYYEGV